MVVKFNKKKNLLNEIKELNNENHFMTIYDIIITNNPDIMIKENENSITLFFHNLVERTYYEIEEFLESLKEDDNEDVFRENILNMDIDNQEVINEQIQFNNKEKNFLNRQKFSKILENENTLMEQKLSDELSEKK